METQRILVTGGSGFIGTNLVNELRNRGHEVLASDLLHHEDEADLYSDSYSDYVRGDIRSYRQMERIFEDNDDFDYVYNLAAEYGRWNGEGYYENLWKTNVMGLKNMKKPFWKMILIILSNKVFMLLLVAWESLVWS